MPLHRYAVRGFGFMSLATSLSWSAVVGALLGLDVGERRIGVAVSDPDGSFALPLRSVDGRQPSQAIDAIRELARDHDAGEIVVGLPLSLGGGDSAQTESVRRFAH
ncbi:MAG TPA: Holliday junction resolvase RuvX, partial [Dehalococcoidia bacterium]|nr:Holliday junction resolvase RuvX [Dehalococcoidia bacterium]